MVLLVFRLPMVGPLGVSLVRTNVWKTMWVTGHFATLNYGRHKTVLHWLKAVQCPTIDHTFHFTGLPGSLPNANQCRSKYRQWSEIYLNADQHWGVSTGIDWHWSAFIALGSITLFWSALISIGQWYSQSWLHYHYNNYLQSVHQWASPHRNSEIKPNWSLLIEQVLVDVS